MTTTPASVSVIVPVLNGASYIREAIDSIAAQTVPVRQIIVVDNGSTDATPDMMRKDSRVDYIRIEERGLSLARNTGMQHASGDFLAYLDADDMWRPTMVERQVDMLNARPDIVASFTNFSRFDDDSGRVLGEQFNYYPELSTFPTSQGRFPDTFVIEMDAFDAMVSMGEVPGYMQTWMFRRSMLGDMPFNTELRMCEDFDYALRTGIGRKIGYVSTTLADVRRHGSNMSQNVARMSGHKLTALKAIAAHVPPASLSRYRDRLVKAHVDAAVSAVKLGFYREACQHVVGCWATQGSLKRKLKGTARLGVTSLQRASSLFRSQI